MDNVIHFEIPVSNLNRAQKFYKEAFKWKMKPMPKMSYTILWTSETDKKGMVKKPGSINGGMMMRNKMINSPVITIAVKNIDKSCKDIRNLGGKILMDKKPVGNMGFIAYFKDSEQNIIGLWQNH
jgi:predicted enzyme related to lactoylglutathione lyase